MEGWAFLSRLWGCGAFQRLTGTFSGTFRSRFVGYFLYVTFMPEDNIKMFPFNVSTLVYYLQLVQIFRVFLLAVGSEISHYVQHRNTLLTQDVKGVVSVVTMAIHKSTYFVLQSL